MANEPELVIVTRSRALEAGFEFSCDGQVGRFLSVLSASVPSGGRIVELGTGTGVGTAWLVHGLGGRRDVEVVSVEADQETAALVINHTWPSYVRFLVDDVVKALPFLGTFDLVFADAPGGKWERLDLSINALNVGGLLVVDDMTPQVGWTADQSANQEAVRMTLLEHPRLVTCDVEWATGIILSVRKG